MAVLLDAACSSSRPPAGRAARDIGPRPLPAAAPHPGASRPRGDRALRGPAGPDRRVKPTRVHLWQLHTEGLDLRLDGTEVVHAGVESGPDPNEQLGRAIAGKLGWPLPGPLTQTARLSEAGRALVSGR